MGALPVPPPLTLSFVNALIFFDQAGQYARWVSPWCNKAHLQVLGAVFVSIGILVTGVVLLSLKSSAKAATDPYTVSTEPSSSIRLRPQPQMRTASGSSHKSTHSKGDDDEVDDLGKQVEARDEVLWEVGSVSDSEKGEEAERKGLGGGGRGEQRGLLDEEDDPDEGPSKRTEEDFGEYEGVKDGSPEPSR